MARDRRREQLVERVLSDPELYPPEFKANLPRLLQDNLNLQIQKQQVQGVTGEQWRIVGATGQPVFTSPWRHYQGGGTAYGTVRFYKDYLGIVHLDGLAETTGTPGSNLIFSLPAGYRPSQVQLVEARGAPGATEAATRLDIIASTGQIQVVTPAYSGFTAGSWVSLANISFRAA